MLHQQVSSADACDSGGPGHVRLHTLDPRTAGGQPAGPGARGHCGRRTGRGGVQQPLRHGRGSRGQVCQGRRGLFPQEQIYPCFSIDTV